MGKELKKVKNEISRKVKAMYVKELKDVFPAITEDAIRVRFGDGDNGVISEVTAGVELRGLGVGQKKAVKILTKRMPRLESEIRRIAHGMIAAKERKVAVLKKERETIAKQLRAKEAEALAKKLVEYAKAHGQKGSDVWEGISTDITERIVKEEGAETTHHGLSKNDRLMSVTLKALIGMQNVIDELVEGLDSFSDKD